MTETFADPLTVAAIASARAAQARALLRWAKASGIDDELRAQVDSESAEVVRQLERGAFDEALAGAEEVMRIAEDEGHGSLWRDFGLQVEEAAETGFAAASLEGE